MSVLNGRMGITNRQLGSERLIPLIAGVRKGLPARGPQRGCIGLKHRWILNLLRKLQIQIKIISRLITR
jgi:hypothetical protein